MYTVVCLHYPKRVYSIINNNNIIIIIIGIINILYATVLQPETTWCRFWQFYKETRLLRITLK